MTVLGRRFVVVAAAIAVVAGSLAVVHGPAAQADGGPPDGMPSQQWVDLASDDPDNTSNQAGWGDLAGGVTDRPYVTSLTLVNGGVETPVIVDGGPESAAVPAGDVTAVVSPVNLCRTDQTPTPGVCYATPNRVALTVGYSTGDGLGYNFADPSVPITSTVTADTVIDMTVALNTLGRSLRWSWVNGDLEYWRTTNLGQADATVRIRFKPAYTPYVASYPEGAGCTATPIVNCDIASSDAQFLSATMLFSLDDTLDRALTGAVFATRGAIAGYLAPGGTAQAPTLDIQAASTHTKPDSNLQVGTIEAFIPAGALLNLYGLLPADATTMFTTTRTGSAGTNSPPTYAQWTAASRGSEGLLVTVDGITFSVPKYRVAGKLTKVTTTATVKGARTTVKATIAGCTKKSSCRVWVYDIGRTTTARYVATRTLVLRDKRVATMGLSLVAPATKLRKGDRYLLVVRSTRTGKLLASSVGTVK